MAIFEAATKTELRDGRSCRFLVDRWCEGQWLRDRFPHLATRVPKKALDGRTVADAVAGGWLTDIGVDLVRMASRNSSSFGMW